MLAFPQVILKPDPGRPQELYLGSLEALGIDTKAHDVRFVEDNWENPTLGAWGLGWEVWMDGEGSPQLPIETSQLWQHYRARPLWRQDWPSLLL